MGTIVAIGGGEIRLGETFLIDKAIAGMAGKIKPNLLFIPTASGESQQYIDTVRDVYEGKLNCIASR